jgi:predicted transcriptional regulator
MTTLSLPPALSARVLRAAALLEKNPETYLLEAVTASTEAALQDFEESCAAIARGLAQEQNGDMIDGDAYLAERRAAREARRQVREFGAIVK